jgi:hypothetical protein
MGGAARQTLSRTTHFRRNFINLLGIGAWRVRCILNGSISVWGQSGTIIAGNLPPWSGPMNETLADLKAELMTEAEGLIDELVAWTSDTPRPTLTQIEDIILKLRQRLSERMALAVIAAQATVRPVPGPGCPTCGREMHYKDMKANTVESRVGVLPLERGYYYCATCQSGLFPPG